MSEKERNNWQGTRSRLEKAGKVAALAGTLAVVAGCTKEGEPIPTIEEAVGPEPTPAEIQAPESVEQEEIKITQEAFGGSKVVAVELRSTQSLNLGVEKMNVIVEEIEKKGLNPEGATYKGFYKVGESEDDDKELVIFGSAPLIEDESNRGSFVVSGRGEDNLVPIEKGNQVQLLDMTEVEVDGNMMFLIEMDGGDFLPILEEINGVWYYTDFYVDEDLGTGAITRMSDELSREVLAVISSASEDGGELIDRLGEGAEVVNGSLVYNGTVIGRLESGNQISFQVEEETIFISTESPEVKDGVLVAINRERTEEMGVDWVEQVWVIGGERVAVPEPQLLPEIYEETLVVKEEALDYFMPKLVAAEKKYLDENGWGENDTMMGLPSLKANTGLPYGYREINIFNKEKGWPSSYDVLVTSWNRIQMKDGRTIDVVGVPFETHGTGFGSSEGKNFVWHFAFDNEATMKWTRKQIENLGNKSEEYIEEIVGRRQAEYVFNGFKRGESLLMVRVFINTENIEGMEGYRTRDYLIEANGFESMAKLVERLEGRVPEYSDLLGREMVYWGSGGGKPNPDPPEWFAEMMEGEIIPSAVLIWDYLE